MFQYIILISAMAIASCAAWFSVTGISQLFMGAPISAIFMATSLEASKLVAVSFVYRYWKEMNKSLRTYMFSGAVVLSIITSAGIYGYLASAYSVSAVDYQLKQGQVGLLQNQQLAFDTRIQQNNDRLSQLYTIRQQQEKRLDELVGRNGFVTQQRVIQSSDAEIQRLQSENLQLQATSDSIGSLAHLEEVTVQSSSKLGSFNYFAEQLGIELDDLVRWFILAIVFVFDPMAVALILAYNFVVMKKQENVTKIVPTVEPSTTSDWHEEPDFDPGEPVLASIVSDKPPANDIPPPVGVEENDIPYYMDPKYNWGTDSRWQSDSDAIHYLKNSHRIDK